MIKYLKALFTQEDEIDRLYRQLEESHASFEGSLEQHEAKENRKARERIGEIMVRIAALENYLNINFNEMSEEVIPGDKKVKGNTVTFTGSTKKITVPHYVKAKKNKKAKRNK